MSTEYQGSREQKKRASGPKKGQGNEKRATKLVSRARNALYQLAQEFKRRQPGATARDAWNNLCAVAETGAHDVLITHDPAVDVLTYRPDVEKIATRQIKFASFASRLSRLA